MRTSRCDDPSRCVLFPSTPRPGGRVSPLADAGNRGGDTPGPTVQTNSAREGEVGLNSALRSGTCCFATRGLRDHRRLPRHASPRSTSGVETVHPLAPPVRRLHQDNASAPRDHPGSTRSTSPPGRRPVTSSPVPG
jgi:hypothetical protein